MHGAYAQQTGRVEGGIIRSSQRATPLFCVSWLILLATNTSVWAAENLSLSASTQLSNEGYFVLNWQPEVDAASFTLEQSSREDFSTPVSRPLGAASAITITGLSDGVYYFRLSRDEQVISNTISVTVEHHSLDRAASFFFLGLALFITLILSILKGNRQTGI
jgi:hypothetical protein